MIPGWLFVVGGMLLVGGVLYMTGAIDSQTNLLRAAGIAGTFVGVAILFTNNAALGLAVLAGGLFFWLNPAPPTSATVGDVASFLGGP